jgi:4-carboxymuconolactone decarboxylase
MTAAQRAVAETILDGPCGRIEGPLRVWLHNPELADRAQALGAYCRYGTSLEPRLSELAIVITGGHWRAGFEWQVHAPLAIAAGIDPAAMEMIRLGSSPVLARPDEQAVFDFATELLRDRTVTDQVYRRAIAILGAAAVIDLVGILGYYGLISMTIDAFAVPLLDDTPDPFLAD